MNTTLSHNHHAPKQYQVQGMSCQACATRLQKVLNKQSKIISSDVNFATETLTVSHENDFGFNELSSLVKKAGFDITPVAPATQKTLPVEEQGIFVSFLRQHWGLVLLFLPFLVGMVAMMFGLHFMLPVALQFVLATTVQFWVARSFYLKAWASLMGGLANMDVLIVLGTLSIWGYSSVIFMLEILGRTQNAAHQVYFEASVMVIFFVSLGKFIESFVKKDSLDAVSLLLQLVPVYVKVKTPDGFRTFATDSVKKDQIVLAKTHDNIALDGIVVQGVAHCDESHLTGESTPIKKEKGDKVSAGAVVLSGHIEYQVEHTSTQTHLAKIIDELAYAQGSKAKIARIGDKVAAVFVPVVVGIAILTFGVNYALTHSFDMALMRAVAVLLIACPCALGLATPAAIMAGMGVAAKHGIWFKDAVSLEQSGKIDVMVFDKTGTLTEGKPKLVGEMVLDGKTEGNHLLAIAASVEMFANHPLAQTIVQTAQERRLPTFETKEVEVGAEGVVAQVKVDDNWHQVKVGKPSLTRFLAAIPKDKLWQTASLVTMSLDNKPILALALIDDIKEETADIIKQLQKTTKVIIMSGDRSPAVSYVANKLDVEEYYAELSSSDKAAKIKSLQEAGKSVCMVGDGVNDALAMTVANTSFAVFYATDIAKNSSSARLMGDSLTQALYAKTIAKKTLAVIHQNLFFAFIYNMVGIVLAMVGLLTPMWAAIFMSMSSLCVVINSVRLKRLKVSS